MTGTLRGTVVGFLGGKDFACNSLGITRGFTLGDAGTLLCGTVVIARSSVGELGGSCVLLVFRGLELKLNTG